MIDKHRQVAMSILKADNSELSSDNIEPFLRKLCLDNGISEEEYLNLVLSGEIFMALLSKVRMNITAMALDPDSDNATKAMKLFLELFDSKYKQKEVVDPLKMYKELTEAERAIRLNKVKDIIKIDSPTNIANKL